MRAIPWKLWLLAVFSAALQMLPFPLAGPVPLWRRAFCGVCLTPLLWVVLYGKNKHGTALKPSQAAWLGYACGVVWYVGNCYWIYQTMYLYGGLPKPAALGILILFSLYLGLYLALFAGVLGWLRRLYSAQMALCAAPLLWVATELARTQITGFPWDLLGYTQVDNLLLTRLAPWTGVMGLSLLVVVGNSLWLLPLEQRSMGRKIAAASFAALVFLGSQWTLAYKGTEYASTTSDNPTYAVLLQENLKVGAEATGPPESKEQMLDSFTQWSLNPRLAIRKGGSEIYYVSMPHGQPSVVIWPEAPADFWDNDPVFQNSLSSLAREEHAPVIADEVTIAPRDAQGVGHLYNSARFTHADGSPAGRYDKMHLVPFGEYTPYKPLFFFVGHLLDNLPFVPGNARRLFADNGHRYGVFICYESIFGDEIRRFVQDGADVLVNISDDGWYGDTSAPWEHLDMARMRAIENDRWLLRATNTGVTTSIDPQGRITTQLPRHIRSALAAEFGYEQNLTFYTRHGDWLGWLCALLSVGAVGWGLVRVRFAKPAEVH
jgi:apolipoprotein N-acyltransferase